jgi:hypothetical protein
MSEKSVPSAKNDEPLQHKSTANKHRKGQFLFFKSSFHNPTRFLNQGLKIEKNDVTDSA